MQTFLTHKESPTSRLRFQRGFTLLELLIVLGIIGAVASAILPNLAMSSGSQMSLTLRELTLTMRNTYDSAVLTGRVHRLVIEIKKGVYWAEQAPLGYQGRPPLVQNDEESARAEERARLLEELNQAAADPRKASDGEREYTNRSILVLKRNILSPIRWAEVDDAVLFRRSVPGNVGFVSIFTPAMEEKMEYTTATDKDVAFLYFFPSGEAIPAAIQLAILNGEASFAEDGPRFTVKLDALTGHSEILDGLIDVDFKADD